MIPIVLKNPIVVRKPTAYLICILSQEKSGKLRGYLKIYRALALAWEDSGNFGSTWEKLEGFWEMLSLECLGLIMKCKTIAANPKMGISSR